MASNSLTALGSVLPGAWGAGAEIAGMTLGLANSIW